MKRCIDLIDQRGLLFGPPCRCVVAVAIKNLVQQILYKVSVRSPLLLGSKRGRKIFCQESGRLRRKKKYINKQTNKARHKQTN